MARTVNQESQELSNIKSELRSIIAKISNVSDDLKSNRGIGIDKCAQRLDGISKEYKQVLLKLEEINFGSAENSNGGSSRRF